MEKAAALDPEFALAHARIGYAYAVTWGYVDKGKPYLTRAFALSDRLTEKDRLNIAAWYAIANLDYENAIQRFREIIEKYPLDSEAYWRLGRLLAGEERRDEALSVLRQGLAVDPENKNLYNSLGGLLSVMGKHDEAIAAHQRYVALAPNETNAYDSLGLSYLWAGDYAAAIENYNRALEINPNFEIALIHLANARFHLGQYREAAGLYRRYISVAPADAERERGYKGIFNIRMRMRDFAGAERSVAKIRAVNGEVIWEALTLAHARGDAARATELETRLLALNQRHNRGARLTGRFEFYRRGTIALKNNRADEAIENFKEALRRQSPIWDIDSLEDCLAKAFIELKRFDEAKAELERILALNPNYPLARFHLAQVFERSSQPAAARENYRLFLETWKNADADIPEIISARNFLSH
ncbi:MAG TPA: tetratricopeptide repeat protein [Pyrinomonadaceae bacterium]